MNKVSGSVWLDGVVSYTGITPRFTQHGIDIYRLVERSGASIIETQGPHIFLQSPSLLVMSIPPEALTQGARYSFSGPGLGSIQMLYGYPAADLGSELRRIEKYSLLVAIDAGLLNFSLNCSAGPVVESARHTGKTYASEQDVRIEFSLPEESLQSVFENKNATERLVGLLRKTGSVINV